MGGGDKQTGRQAERELNNQLKLEKVPKADEVREDKEIEDVPRPSPLPTI